MKKTIFFAATMLAVACVEAPKTEEAITGTAQETRAVSADASKFSVDIQQSKVEWLGTKPTGSHHGIVKISEGMLMIKDAEISGGNFSLDMNSIEGIDQSPEDNIDLAGHLKDEDFFNSAKYPTAKFEITSIAPLDTGKKPGATDEPIKEKSIDGVNMTVTGNLTIRDSVKSISFPAKVSVTENQIMAEANFNINRTDWGIKYKSDKSPGNKFIYHTINIGVKLVANREEE